LFAISGGQGKGELEAEDDQLSQSGSELNSSLQMVGFYSCHFVVTAILVVSKNGITTFFCEFRGCFYVHF